MSDYIDFLKEVFTEFGPVNARRMFGGHGLYFDGLMFGLVTQDTLYLKADAENQHFFETEGLEKFSYEKQGKRHCIAYFQAPDQLYDDPEEAALWARRSWEAAVRGAAKKRPK
jgi:DNA transformation protein